MSQQQKAAVLTVGYSGLDVDSLVSYAKEINAVVVDTRYRPYSRNPTWRKGNLIAQFRTGNGHQRYMHISDLGNLNYKGGPIAISDPEAGLPKVKALLDAGFRVILMCVCRDPERCHRSVVADMLVEEYGVTVRHLTAVEVEDPNAPRPQRLI